MKVTEQLLNTYESINDCTYKLGYQRDRLPKRLTVMTCKNLLTTFKSYIPKKTYKELDTYIDTQLKNSVSIEQYLDFEEKVITSGTFDFKYKDLKKYRKYNTMEYIFGLESMYKEVGLMSLILIPIGLILTHFFSLFINWDLSLLIGLFLGTIIALLIMLHIHNIPRD